MKNTRVVSIRRCWLPLPAPFVRPIRPLRDADTRELDDLVTRHRQLVAMRVQETLRLGTAATPSLRKNLKAHVAWLDKQIAQLDGDLSQRLRAPEVWKAKDDLQGIPGVGTVTSVTLLAQCPELGRLNRREIAKLTGALPVAFVPGGEAARRFRDELDNAHLMRMAGRFSRRVRVWAKANGVPVVDCGSEERKHKIAEEHLKKNPDVRGVFLVLVGRAVATVWDVKRSPRGSS